MTLWTLTRLIWSDLMRLNKYMQNVLIGGAAALIAGAHFLPGTDKDGPVMAAATAMVSGKPAADSSVEAAPAAAASAATAEANTALAALSSLVRPLSSSQALEDAFHSYFAYKTAHPDEV